MMPLSSLSVLCIISIPRSWQGDGKEIRYSHGHQHYVRHGDHGAPGGSGNDTYMKYNFPQKRKSTVKAFAFCNATIQTM